MLTKLQNTIEARYPQTEDLEYEVVLISYNGTTQWLADRCTYFEARQIAKKQIVKHREGGGTISGWEPGWEWELEDNGYTVSDNDGFLKIRCITPPVMESSDDWNYEP
ncbi:MAG TPA: hypothetical protein V6C65_40835 [Allocoleopsis sp.]